MSAPARVPAAGGAGVRGAPFTAALLAWLNARFAPRGPAIEAHTPLFAGGVLNSMRILDLIAWTERATGRRVPDAEIRTDNFGTAARITETFAPDASATVTGRADAQR